MSHSFSAANKLTQPRNNAITTLSVAAGATGATQRSPLYLQFPYADASKFYSHRYVGRRSSATSGQAHGYVTVGTEAMWFDSITAIGSNRRFKVTKRRVNMPAASHVAGRYIQQRITAQHFIQIQAFLTSMSARFSTSGRRSTVDVSSSRNGYEYVGSQYDIGRTMWNAVTRYASGLQFGSISLPTSANWESTYRTVNSNSASWAGGESGQPLSSYSRGWQNLVPVSSSTRGWQRARSTVSSNSATWSLYQQPLSSYTAGWNNVVTVSGSTRSWQAAKQTVSSNSATWGSTYTTVWGRAQLL